MQNQTFNRSQILTLAWTLYRTGLTFSEAQRKAWKIADLKNRMRQGAVKFTYQKTDGTTRQAIGTTSARYFSYQRKTSRPAPAKVVTYFDLQKNSFRSFRASNLIDAA
jgi:hypothetical protein